MKNTLLLALLCCIPTISHSAFQFGGGSSSSSSSAASGQQIADQMRKCAQAKAALEARQKAYAQGGYLDVALMKAVDEAGAKVRETLIHCNEIATEQREAFNTIAGERIEQVRAIVGEETRAAIKASCGNIFKATFCTSIAALGIALIYKNLYCDDKEEGENVRKEKYIKAGIGATCIASAGILGHYWFS